MVSIGTGMPKLASLSDRAAPNVLALKVIALDTERAAESFRRDKADLDEEGRYYRFNVVRGLETVGLHEAGKKAEIAAATSQYVASQEVAGEMRRCANALTSRKCESIPAFGQTLSVVMLMLSCGRLWTISNCLQSLWGIDRDQLCRSTFRKGFSGGLASSQPQPSQRQEGSSAPRARRQREDAAGS
jgi:hypothetical protein